MKIGEDQVQLYLKLYSIDTVYLQSMILEWGNGL